MKYPILLSLVLLVAACGPTSQDESSGPLASGTPGVNDEEIVLGNQTDLSGDLAPQGAGSINGARMRFDEVNAAGGIHGRQIKLIVEDTESKVPGAVGAVSNLIGQDHVFAMVLSLGTKTDEAVLPEQMKKGVPNMYPLNGAREMVLPVNKLKFTERPTWYDEMRAAVAYFIANKSSKVPCVVYDDDDVGHAVIAAVEDQLKAMKRTASLSIKVPAGQQDYGDAVARLADAQCDVVFMGTGHSTAGLLLSAAHKAKFATDFVGTDEVYGEHFTSLDDGAGEGLYAATPMARLHKDDQMSPRVRKWWDAYVEKYGDEPRLPAMEGYRAADLVVRALDGAGNNPTRESFIKATENLKDYTDLFGYHLSFGSDNHKGTNQSVLSEIEGGKWKVVAQSIQG